MAYCPNCARQVDIDAKSCPGCDAEFGAPGGWTPQSQQPRIPRARQHQRDRDRNRHPSRSNVLAALPFFMAIGPLIGWIGMMMLYPRMWSASGFGGLFLSILWSYIFGVIPASLAAVIYIPLALLISHVIKTQLSVLLAGALGALAGGAAVELATLRHLAPKNPQFLTLGILAGTVAALSSSHFFPVGRRLDEALESAIARK